jgi:hypothetical protein
MFTKFKNTNMNRGAFFLFVVAMAAALASLALLFPAGTRAVYEVRTSWRNRFSLFW